MNTIRYNNIETNINQRNEQIRGDDSTGRSIIYIRNQTNILRNNNNNSNNSENNNNKTKKKCSFCYCDLNCKKCLVPRFLVLITLGIITIMKGCNEKCLYKIYLGIFIILNNILFIFILAYVINIVEMYLFYYVYSLIVLIFLSIIAQIFTCRKLEEKDKKILTLLLNIFVGGSGTLIYGLEIICLKSPPMTRWEKIKHLLFGIIQFVGFSLFVTSFSYYGSDGSSTTNDYYNYEKETNDYTKGIILSVIGSICYIFSLFSAILLLCKND